MNINQFCNHFPDEVACRKYLERVIWPSGRVCPHCGCLDSWRIKGDSSRSGLYECSGCSGQFTVTTKTPLHSTKLPLKTWLLAMYFIVTATCIAGGLRKAPKRGLSYKFNSSCC